MSTSFVFRWESDYILERESEYQSKLKEKLLDRFPGAYIFKTDPSQKRGAPDLIILYSDTWAALEVKRNSRAKHRPLQDRRIEELNRMGFAAIIFPENESEVLNEMERAFNAGW